jgi:hypothetical protein
MPAEPSPTPATPTPETELRRHQSLHRRLPRQYQEPRQHSLTPRLRQPRRRQPKSLQSPPDLDPKAFKLPEGVLSMRPRWASSPGVAKELGINQEGAQRLVDFYAKQAKAEAVKPYEQWHAMQKQWQDEIKADPTIGGDKLEPALQKSR